MAEKGLQDKGRKVGEGLIKGTKAYQVHQGHRYNIRVNPTATRPSSVIITDRGATTAAAAARGQPPRGNWVARIDGPHPGAEFNHININPAISGRPDPHIPLPPGACTLEAGRKTATFLKAANTASKVLVPAAIAVDVVRTGIAIKDDFNNGTSRNTVETVAGITGGWGAGFGGAVGGAAIGSAIFPGAGTIIGGIVGGVTGGISGAIGATAVVDAIGDGCDYDMETRKCRKCGKPFKNRNYCGENKKLCPTCEEEEEE